MNIESKHLKIGFHVLSPTLLDANVIFWMFILNDLIRVVALSNYYGV